MYFYIVVGSIGDTVLFVLGSIGDTNIHDYMYVYVAGSTRDGDYGTPATGKQTDWAILS